jgi:hypothetical protein
MTSGEPVVTTLVCLFYYLHARLRVHQASGIPCALCHQGAREILGKARARGAARTILAV